ncbi:hypothetical protein [Saccharothrix luteola]|uniref:hypothetical protein n=1 Tax=Saccharothrix luteola TaxID=2893018 RepID=UPI001E2AAD7C|nr:hypothetical protein [Saccharothrix luteola]MCC8243083.1 hypothetical protein [Saccharothrix luteola]
MNTIEEAGNRSRPDGYPYAFHIALDGNGLNGLEGRVGFCVFQYDPVSGRHTSRIEYYDGLSGGHAISLSPDRRTGLLGNTGQHLAFYDTARPEETERSPLSASNPPTPRSKAAPTRSGWTARPGSPRSGSPSGSSTSTTSPPPRTSARTA